MGLGREAAWARRPGGRRQTLPVPSLALLLCRFILKARISVCSVPPGGAHKL